MSRCVWLAHSLAHLRFVKLTSFACVCAAVFTSCCRGFNESCPVCKLERCSFCLRGVQPTPGTMPCCCDHVERPASPSAQELYLVKYLCKTDTCIPERAHALDCALSLSESCEREARGVKRPRQ